MAANTYRETVRERVLYNLIFFAILMMLCALFLGQLSIRQDEKIVKDVGLAAMEIVGTLIAVFIGVGLVSKEIERRSLQPLLAKPLRRGEFLLGKFLGLGLTLLVNTAVMAVGLALTLLVIRRTFDPHLLKAVYTLYLGLLLVVALAMLFSTLTSSALAALSTVGLVVAGHFSDVVRSMAEVAPDVPPLLIRVIYYALPNFRYFDLKTRAVYGDPISWAELGGVTLYALAYMGLVLGAAQAAFARKDVP